MTDRLEVMASTTYGASRRAEERQHDTYDEQNDSDGPQHRNLEQESGDEQDDSENNHGRAFLVRATPCVRRAHCAERFLDKGQSTPLGRV